MNAKSLHAVFIGLCLLTALPASANILPPKNECRGDKQFGPISSKIVAAAQQRNTKALMALLAPDVQIDFGGSKGKQAFARLWHIDRGAKAPLWDELDAMIRLGCAVEKNWAAFPYLFARAPETDDPFSQYLVTGRSVAMRASPHVRSRKIATLNWDVVTALEESKNKVGWRHVVRSDGTKGYVSENLLRSSVGYRLIIGFVRGKPLITHFIAGD